MRSIKSLLRVFGCGFADVLEGARDQVGHVLIGELVVHDPALLAMCDESCLTQKAQLMAGHRLAQWKARGDVTDAQFAGAQGRQNAQSCRIGDRFEKCARIVDTTGIRNRSFGSGDRLRVQALNFG